MMGYNDFGWSMGFGTGIFGWTLMIIFWGVIIWLIFWLIKQNMHNTAGVVRGVYRDPKSILKSRYAKGEITAKEYHDMKNELDDDSIF